MARKCVFCGGTPVTDEHVLPEWVQNVLPSPQPLMVFGKRHVDVTGQETGEIHYWEAPIDVKVKRVCERCNTTWMSNLENEAKPILTPMILGRPTRLDVDQQSLVAAWGFKVFLLTRYLHKRILIPPEHYDWFYRHRQPPKAVRISIGEYEGKAYTQFLASGSAPPPEDPAHDPEHPTEYRCSFNVGRLIYAGFGEVGRDDSSGFLVAGARTYVAEIWPSMGAISWPPARYITDEVWRMLHPRVPE